MIVDYHMHLENGDLSLEYVGRFLAVARERGVDEVGFTEHSYRFRQAHGLLDNAWAREREEADLEAYLGLLQAARAAGLPVKIGIEVDYVPGKEREIAAFLSGHPWDLVLGSVHWLGDWGIDLDPATWAGRDVERVYRDYYATLKRAAESGLFDVLSHPDLVKIFGFRPEGDVTDAAEEAVAAAARHGLALEISSAGLRKPVGEIYPAPGILALARRHGVPVTLASDAHFPRHVGHAYPELIAYARRAGFDQVCVFSGRRRTLAPLGPAPGGAADPARPAGGAGPAGG